MFILHLLYRQDIFNVTKDKKEFHLKRSENLVTYLGESWRVSFFLSYDISSHMAEYFTEEIHNVVCFGGVDCRERSFQ